MIVTSFSQEGYHQYGKRFIESFLRYWPEEERLEVYYENGIPKDAPQDLRLTYRNLYDSAPFVAFAKTLEQSDPIYSGKVVQGGKTAYNYRYDANKFFRKVFAMHSATRPGCDKYVAWVDADVETIADVPRGFLSSLYTDAEPYCIYLGRDWYHTESGFLAFDTQHAEHALFMDAFLYAYFSGAFRFLGELHDCYVFDFLRLSLGISCRNLTEHPEDRYLFDSSILGQYMRHDKGPDRKDTNCS